MLTFGLLSAGKEIENVIEAMATIMRRNQIALYVVLGATHPPPNRALRPDGSSAQPNMAPAALV
jgi:hypothetical protein